jgi:arylsulfatase A-like enzyme
MTSIEARYSGQYKKFLAIDILPTPAHVCGITLPEEAEIEGRNIVETLFNDMYIDKRILYWRTPEQYALRNGDWKLVFSGSSLDKGYSELFNFKNDPLKRNLAIDKPEILAEMLNELKNQADLDDMRSFQNR